MPMGANLGAIGRSFSRFTAPHLVIARLVRATQGEAHQGFADAPLDPPDEPGDDDAVNNLVRSSS
jgi:hypothetical protein